MYYSKRNNRPISLAWRSLTTQAQAQTQTPGEKALAQAQALGSKFFLFLVLALMLGFAQGKFWHRTKEQLGNNLIRVLRLPY